MTNWMFIMQYDTMCCRMSDPRVSAMAGTGGSDSVRPVFKRCL